MSETSGLCCAANSNCNECWHHHLSSVWNLCHFSAPSVPPHLNTKMLHSHLHNLNVWKSIALFSKDMLSSNYVAFMRSCVHGFSLVKEISLCSFDKIFILFVVTVDRGVVVRMYWKYPLFLNLKQQVSTSFGLWIFFFNANIRATRHLNICCFTECTHITVLCIYKLNKECKGVQ